VDNLNSFFGRFGVLFLAAAVLAACGSPKVSDSLYRDSEVGTSKHVVRCRVLETREVAIREDDAPEKGEAIGAIIGGIAGAILGSQIGGGKGQALAMEAGVVAGAVAGGAGGRQAADKMSERKGIEYSVILEDGEELTLVQDWLEGDRVVQAGETCRLQVANDGKNRVLPAEHLPESIAAPKATTIAK
jgi:outer membrane lipoprotein SlyB